MTILKYKKIAYIALLLSCTQVSCTDYFEVTDNPSLVTNPSINGMLATATHKAAMNSYSVSYIISNYCQYTASSTPGSATDNYEPTNPASTWDALYYSLSDLQDLITAAEKEGASQHKGIGQILMAYQLGLVADLWGSAPYSEAFGKVNTLQPKYDTEEELYNAQATLINEGLNNLALASTLPFTANSDLIHKNNIANWIKTGNALKARLLNKISKKSNYDPNAVLAAIDLSYTSNSDNANMAIFNGINPWSSVARDNENLLLDGWLSANFINHLNGTKFGTEDPRIAKITEKTIKGDIYIGTINGQGNIGSNTDKDECYISRKSPLTSDNSPVTIISFAEIKMIEAEAALKSNNKSRAYQAYKDGILAHFNLLGLNADEADTYFNRSYVNVGQANLTVNDIFREKFIITYLNAEAWNDLRRNDYKIKDFNMPLNAKLPNFIRRLAYPTSERSENGANVPAEVALDTQLWWDKQ